MMRASEERRGRWTGPLSRLVLGGLLLWYVVYGWRNHRVKARKQAARCGAHKEEGR